MTFIRWSVVLGAVLLAMSSPEALGQSSADALFHEAAQHYVAGDAEAARRTVRRGLEVAPSDARLQALLKKLERQENRGGGQSSQSGQQEQSSGQQPKDRPTEGDRSGAPEGESDAEAEQGRRSDRSQQQKASSSQSPRTERRSQNTRRQAGPEGTNRRRSALSQAQVARLLQALENQERKLLREVRVRSTEQTAVEKDW